MRLRWTELPRGGLFSILAEVTKAGGVKEEVTSWQEKEKLLEDLTKDWTFYSHGRVNEYGDCAVLEDGSVLACLTVASFAGTFASYDDISVEWWIGK